MGRKTTKTYDDILYLFILCAITELFNHSVMKVQSWILILFGILGIFVLELWFARVISLYASKKISKYSDVMMKINIKNRFFAYFVLPAIFYMSVLLFLYYNMNTTLDNIVLTVCMVLFLILFLNVKGSLNKYYSVEISTRAIFDFICITILYLSLNSYLRMGLSNTEFMVASLVSSLTLFIFILKLHDRIGWLELAISLLCSAIVALSMFIVIDRNIFIIPAVGALIFYLIVSIWNIRFSGKIKLSEYILPIAYTALALTLVLTF